jgi:hypothetical protein
MIKDKTGEAVPVLNHHAMEVKLNAFLTGGGE